MDKAGPRSPGGIKDSWPPIREVLGIIVPTRPYLTKPRGLIPLSGIREAVRQRIRGHTITTISTI